MTTPQGDSRAHTWRARPGSLVSKPVSDGRGGFRMERREIGSWLQCSNCGVSKAMADHMGWGECQR